eukprot:TRINITY_DN6761_c1_g2_i1.p1 TRINITY_DN6761_c1_g2~~TRINITY_DN6761_c1_g2_i1.p1  ORF type:complete len:282 (-),score=34.68 TRINITY_DN6761_c1_g2_i1:33-878(-)
MSETATCDTGADDNRSLETCCNFDWDKPFSKELCADLRNARCYWTGSPSHDYMLHVANWHPLVSVFACHPAHPYSKIERLVVLMLTCALSLLPAAALTQTMTKSGSRIASMSAPIAVFFIITLPVMVIQVVMEKLAVADSCFRDETRARGIKDNCCNCMRFIALSAHCACMIFTLIITAIVVACSFVVVRKNIQEALSPFLVSRAQSWLLWFPLDLFMPCLGFIHCWRAERKAVEEKAKNRAKAYQAGDEVGQEQSGGVRSTVRSWIEAPVAVGKRLLSRG